MALTRTKGGVLAKGNFTTLGSRNRIDLGQTINVCILLCILGLAIALRLSYLINMDFPPVENDQENYTKMAIQLLERGIYAYSDSTSNALVTPGFPVFLAVVFKLFGYDPVSKALMTVRFIQMFMSLVYIYLLYLIGNRLFHSIAGLLAAFFAAIYGPYVMMTSLILTEELFVCCFLALIYFQVRMIQANRRSDHIWAGIFLGLSVLFRPNSLIVAVTPYLFLWSRNYRIDVKEAACGICAFAVIMLPWWVRNALTFHEFVFIARGEAGNPFLGGTDPYGKVPIDWSTVKPEDQFREGVRRIREGLRSEPLLWIRWFTFGKLAAMFKNSIYWWPYPKAVYSWYADFLKGLHYVIVYAGMFFTAAAFYCNSVCFLAINFCLFLGVHLLFIPEPRYTIGMMPFLMLLTAACIVWTASSIWQIFRRFFV